MKSVVKRVAEYAIAATAPVTWHVRKPSLLVLMYHRVLPADHPDRATEQSGMFVSPETLRMHVDYLKRAFTLVHLDDWLADARAARALPRLACALTFDDGWRDNYEHAFPVLRESGVPATIFLVSDLVGTRYSFWPNALARTLASDEQHFSALPSWLVRLLPPRAQGALTMAQIDTVIDACKRERSDEEMTAALKDVAPAHAAASDRDLMSWDEVRHMQASGLVRFGSHTRRHTRLSTLSSPQQLSDEIVASREIIADQLSTLPRTFCYPNGDTSRHAVELVRQSYMGAVTTQRGWHDPAGDAWTIRRIGVHEDITRRRASFIARLSGWL